MHPNTVLMLLHYTSIFSLSENLEAKQDTYTDRQDRAGYFNLKQSFSFLTVNCITKFKQEMKHDRSL